MKKNKFLKYLHLFVVLFLASCKSTDKILKYENDTFRIIIEDYIIGLRTNCHTKFIVNNFGDHDVYFLEADDKNIMVEYREEVLIFSVSISNDSEMCFIKIPPGDNKCIYIKTYFCDPRNRVAEIVLKTYCIHSNQTTNNKHSEFVFKVH